MSAEDKLIMKQPTGGLHEHTEENPFGLHRHHAGDPLDGAHKHTPENPYGEHIHGEYAGMAMIDGAHTHSVYDLGWHRHKKHKGLTSAQVDALQNVLDSIDWSK